MSDLSFSLPQPLHPIKYIGHEKQYTILKNSLTKGMQHHAWLFHGPKGIGKQTMGFRGVHYLLSDHNISDWDGPSSLLFDEEPTIIAPDKPADTDFDFDFTLSHHRQIIGHSHPNFIFVDNNPEKSDGKETSILVDQIRTLIAWLQLSAADSRLPKVVMIDGIENANSNAQNSLLKILEEPPKNTYFFLICNHLSKLAPTIISRCLSLQFSPLSVEESMQILSQEAPDIPEYQINLLLNLSANAPGMALALWEQDALTLYNHLLDFCQDPDAHIDTLNAVAALNIAHYKLWRQLVTHIILRITSALIQGKEFHPLSPKEESINDMLRQSAQTSSFWSRWYQQWLGFTNAAFNPSNIDRRQIIPLSHQSLALAFKGNFHQSLELVSWG